MIAGTEGSVGVREVRPPRRRITCSGLTDVAERERKRVPTAATACDASSRWLSLSPSRRQASRSACSAVESTSRRRFTTHQMRVGAVRSAGRRSACEANHHTAMSRQAVLPRPVCTPTDGHVSVRAISSAKRACHGNGSRPFIAR